MGAECDNAPGRGNGSMTGKDAEVEAEVGKGGLVVEAERERTESHGAEAERNEREGLAAGAEKGDHVAEAKIEETDIIDGRGVEVKKGESEGGGGRGAGAGEEEAGAGNQGLRHRGTCTYVYISSETLS